MQLNSLKVKPARIIGIDFGMSRFGLAISDERQIIASPFRVVQAEKKTEQTISKILAVFKEIESSYSCTIVEIIIGMPLMMSGRKGLLADEVKHFIDLLSLSTSTPIHTWDERLSTVQAERLLRESHMSRKKRSKVVDSISASIILQSYLDRQAFAKELNDQRASLDRM